MIFIQGMRVGKTELQEAFEEIETIANPTKEDCEKLMNEALNIANEKVFQVLGVRKEYLNTKYEYYNIPVIQLPVDARIRNEKFEREYLGEWGKDND